ncbi:RNA polymerase subunit sigma-70 [Anaerosporomusa subterranea]|uniref:RNA polymerase subunit sigma-70 n=1 Tax=Anaerosporomusa subterranea TaxID=1794912 RepID=A0A154BQV2_ANASB|nr:sigma-70 family RNA polymerase sigma factor [Anaerosporomusa subterranea]KYZ76364.1 RNA polymerase subunit sigma-70 [Anaerosporomusa subterranea]
MSLNKYLAELKQVRMLEPEEERELWRLYKKNGDHDSRRTLIEHYQPLVFKTAARWRGNESAIMDIIQEGTIGLIEAVENFDPDRNVAFSLYAVHRIRGRILNYAEREGELRCLSIDSPLNDEESVTLENRFLDGDQTVAAQAENNFLVSQVKTAMERLPANERLVLNGVYLAEQEPKELAETMNLSLSHIYRLQKQGVRRVRGMLSKLMQHW